MERKTTQISQAEVERQLTLCDDICRVTGQWADKPLALVDTYGCQQNEADSERIRGYLERMGFGFTDDPEQARIITELENDGVAHVALISRNNDQLAEELLAEQDKTLQEIYFPETLTEDGENEGTDATGDPASAEDSGENTQSTPTSNTPESGE